MLRKTSATTPIQAQVVNTASNSTTDTYSCNYINDCNTYSTSETFTGKYWIDGKPIYRKVLSVTGTIGNTIAHNIANIDYVSIVQQSFYYNNNWFHGYVNDNFFVNAYAVDNTDVKIAFGNSWSGLFTKAIIILEYTKTTD